MSNDPQPILEAVAGVNDPTELTPVQKLLGSFAWWLMIAIFAIMAALILQWIFQPIPMPKAPDGSDATAIKAYLDNVQQATTIANQRTVAIFDMVITKALLPVFTTVLGYLIGRAADSKQS